MTGQTRYTDDLALPGLLHAVLVRSPYAAARITSIDTTVAQHVPGVARVLTARHLPVPRLEDAVAQRRILLALDQVYYAGQPVVVVLGETRAAAEDGAALVEVDYEPSPAVVDPEEALNPDAPVVRVKHGRDEAELAMHGAAAQESEEDEAQAPNVTSQVRYRRGDVEQGLRQADVVVEKTYRTSWVHQSYVEPQTCAAFVDPLGTMTVYASTQALFHVRSEVAATLGLAEHQVKVYPMPVGGGFGGKFGLIETTVAAIARAVGRPVRLTFTRMDEMVTGGPAPQSVVRVRAGARSDGILCALDADILFDAGAHAGTPVGVAALLIGPLYRWENVAVRGREVLTHKSGAGAYRAPGAPQATFALESTIDELARALGMDQVDVRRKNLARTGDQRVDGAAWNEMGLGACLDRAEPLYRQELARKGPGEGVGLAMGGWFGGIEPSSAVCRLDADGTLQVALGSVDLTGTNTTFAIIAAEAFGLEDPSQVRVTTVDTDAAPYAGASGGSKITYTVGPSVLQAAQDAREQVLTIAAAELEASVDDLEIVGGQVRVRGVPGKVKTLGEIYTLSASFGARYAPVLGRGRAAVSQQSPGMGVHVVRVRVDPETGRVQPLRYVVVQDVGRAINPATVEEQIMGGAVQGVGWGLYERLVWDEAGTPITASWMDYVVPRATQSPEMETVLVEIPSAVGPYGAKGVGEPPAVPGAAALANAVRDATGARVTEIPLTSERVQRAMATLGD